MTTINQTRSIYYYNGSHTFTLNFDYLDPSHIKVDVNGFNAQFDIVGEGLINVYPISEWKQGDKVIIYRETPIVGASHRYKNGDMITETTLNSNLDQVRYVVEELYTIIDDAPIPNASGDIDYKNIRLINAGQPVDPNDVATKQYVDNVIPNYVNSAKHYAQEALQHKEAVEAFAQSVTQKYSEILTIKDDLLQLHSESEHNLKLIERIEGDIGDIHKEIGDLNISLNDAVALVRRYLSAPYNEEVEDGTYSIKHWMHILLEIMAHEQRIGIGAVVRFYGLKYNDEATSFYNTLLANGYLIADGSIVKRRDYPDLWDTVKGIAIPQSLWHEKGAGKLDPVVYYGDGDGIDTFCVPDTRGVFERNYQRFWTRDMSRYGKSDELEYVPDMIRNFDGRITIANFTISDMLKDYDHSVLTLGKATDLLDYPVMPNTHSSVTPQAVDLKFDLSKATPSVAGPETAPKNVPVLSCIKAKTSPWSSSLLRNMAASVTKTTT
ncbi:MAG: phage tail fiber protein [Candidatus Thiodiazotropha endolucinida]